MRKRYIFLDIDGTIVDFDCKMPKSAKDAILRAQSEGHSVLISTGRLFGQIYSWLLDEILFDGFVTSSGAMAKYRGEVIFKRFMTKGQLERFHTTVAKHGGIGLYHTDSCIIAEPGALEREIEFMEKKCGLLYENFKSLLENTEIGDPIAHDNIEKAIYLDALSHEEMRRELGSDFKIDRHGFRGIPDNCGEVTLADVSKADGIKALMRHLGVERADTVAIGDGDNDSEMVAFAGLGIAMGNASEGLKAIADYVTDDIKEDGLAKAINLIVDGKI